MRPRLYCPILPGRRLFDRLQFFSWFEADSLSWRNAYFGACARVASNAGLARTHVEDAEAAQLNAVAVSQSLLHALEDGLDCHFGLRLGYPSLVHDFVNDVELDHTSAPLSVS